MALILEVEWFDRIGNLGRRAVCSLAALDAEFVGIEPAAGRSFRGGLPDSLPEANLHASVVNQTWQRAENLARAFLARIKATTGFSQRFEACIAALERHIETAGGRIGRLG